MRNTSLPMRDDEKLSSEGFEGYKGGYEYALVHPEDPEVEQIAQGVRKGVCLTQDDFDPDGHLVEVLHALGCEVRGRDDFSFGFMQGVHDGWELFDASEGAGDVNIEAGGAARPRSPRKGSARSGSLGQSDDMAQADLDPDGGLAIYPEQLGIETLGGEDAFSRAFMQGLRSGWWAGVVNEDGV